MGINRKLLGPQGWREYPVFWWESLKFKVEMKIYKILKGPKNNDR